MAQNTEKTPKKRSWGYMFKVVGLNLLIMGVVAFGLVWGLSSWLDSYTRHDEHIELPSLQGSLAEDAINYLNSIGLQAMVVDSVYAGKAPGTVIEQMPTAGLPVKKGRIVYLTIQSVSSRKVKMQSVIDAGSRQALSTLTSLGFVVDSIKLVAGSDDLVLSVTVQGDEAVPGEEYPYGTHVVMFVGSSGVQMEEENDEIEEEWLE